MAEVPRRDSSGRFIESLWLQTPWEKWPASQQLDVLVAIDVLGWAITEDVLAGSMATSGPDGVTIPLSAFDSPEYQFSRNLGAAWKVVDHLRATGYDAFSLAIDDQIPGQAWRAQFSDGNRSYGEGLTPAVAICRAALNAVGREVSRT